MAGTCAGARSDGHSSFKILSEKDENGDTGEGKAGDGGDSYREHKVQPERYRCSAYGKAAKRSDARTRRKESCGRQ